MKNIIILLTITTIINTLNLLLDLGILSAIAATIFSIITLIYTFKLYRKEK